MSEKSRVRWLCRRGMKELDVLLERFMAAEYDGLEATRRSEFIRLLENEDPVLYALIMGRAAPDNAVQADVLDRIRRFERPVAAP